MDKDDYTYAVIVLHSLGNEGIDEQGELCLGRGHVCAIDDFYHECC